MPRQEYPAALLPLPPRRPRQPVTVNVTGTPSLWRRSSCWFVWIPTTVKTIARTASVAEHDPDRHLADTPAVHRHAGAAQLPDPVRRARGVRVVVASGQGGSVVGHHDREIVVGSAARLAAALRHVSRPPKPWDCGEAVD